MFFSFHFFDLDHRPHPERAPLPLLPPTPPAPSPPPPHTDQILYSCQPLWQSVPCSNLSRYLSSPCSAAIDVHRLCSSLLLRSPFLITSLGSLSATPKKKKTKKKTKKRQPKTTTNIYIFQPHTAMSFPIPCPPGTPPPPHHNSSPCVSCPVQRIRPQGEWSRWILGGYQISHTPPPPPHGLNKSCNNPKKKMTKEHRGGFLTLRPPCSPCLLPSSQTNLLLDFFLTVNVLFVPLFRFALFFKYRDRFSHTVGWNGAA